MAKIIITGATGLIGKKLTEFLVKEKNEIIIFTRNPESAKTDLPDASSYIEWDYKKDDWYEHVNGIHSVVHLAGANLFAKRWTPEYKQIIYDSRIESTNKLIAAIRKADNKPESFICSSAVGFYGDGGETVLTEDASSGNGFLAEVCKDWEKAAAQVEELGVRRVSIRSGIALSKKDGALPPMITQFKLFAGGYFGSGKQWFPWIHLDDIALIYKYAIENQITGPVNGASPNVIRMKEFAHTLGDVMNRPSFFPIPGFIMKLAAGESAEAVLSGQRLSEEKLLSSGFKFNFDDLETALRDLLGKLK